MILPEGESAFRSAARKLLGRTRWPRDNVLALKVVTHATMILTAPGGSGHSRRCGMRGELYEPGTCCSQSRAGEGPVCAHCMNCARCCTCDRPRAQREPANPVVGSVEPYRRGIGRGLGAGEDGDNCDE